MGVLGAHPAQGVGIGRDAQQSGGLREDFILQGRGGCIGRHGGGTQGFARSGIHHFENHARGAGRLAADFSGKNRGDSEDAPCVGGGGNAVLLEIVRRHDVRAQTGQPVRHNAGEAVAESRVFGIPLRAAIRNQSR